MKPNHPEWDQPRPVVAPRAGAWVETIEPCILAGCPESHPVRVRGLKQTFVDLVL